MALKVKNQDVSNNHAIYCGDSGKVFRGFGAGTVGLSIYSPPFSSLYSYSDSTEDLGNSKSHEEFFDHYRFIVEELYRVTMPGRISAVHCMPLPTFKSKGEEIGTYDFPGDIIRCYQDAGWIYHCPPITIWKDPLVAATRTKAIGLAHKQIVKDSTLCRTGFADYIIAFRKPGENPEPVAHPDGLTMYYGEREIPRHLDRYENHTETKTNKRSHWIWQQYASPVWDDIRQTKVLPFQGGREKDDQRHICPLQLDVVYRTIILWSNPGDVVCTPFLGVGTEVYCALKLGRKGVGVELKDSYWRQARKNLAHLKPRREEFSGNGKYHREEE